MVNWSYGVTTVPQRLNTLLPRTLASLAVAGFDQPRLFVDGPYPSTDRPVTQRDSPVEAFGNWLLAIWELYIREPQARMYAVFQDDMVLCRGVKRYLEDCDCPSKGYLNLFTFATNESRIFGKPAGWHLSDQLGRGALALVFSHEAVVAMLQQSHIVHKPQLDNSNQSIDGAVQHALVAQAGFAEYVHQPSLAQHTGETTTIGPDSLGRLHPKHIRKAKTFPGEQFDVTRILT